jgi:hypothetical protein
MRLNINESEMLTEMAKIGSISNKVGQAGNYFIFVYNNERAIPHFHIKEKTGTFSCCIKIKEADYYIHGKHKDILTKDLKKSLIYFLNSSEEPFTHITNFQNIVMSWNNMNENNKVNTSTMPDYEQLETIG